jgi:hypothetical protein
LFGRVWLPASLLTWLVPVGLLGGGGVLALLARARLRAIREGASGEPRSDRASVDSRQAAL